MSEEGKILSAKKNGVGTLIFSNPERLNAMSREMTRAAAEVMEDFTNDPEVRVVIVTGAGKKAFISGGDISKFEKARATPARGAGDVLPALLKDLKLDTRRAEAEVVKVWNDLIDPVVTAHAQPANLHKGTLFVNVDSSVWLTEIVRYRRKEIIERLQHSFGKSVVQKISFRIG